jgi:transposase
MFTEVSMVEVREVLRLRQQGRFQREISRLVSLDRKTVRRYLEVAPAAGFDLAQLRPGRPGWHGVSWTRLEGQHAFVEEQLEAG